MNALSFQPSTFSIQHSSLVIIDRMILSILMKQNIEHGNRTPWEILLRAHTAQRNQQRSFGTSVEMNMYFSEKALEIMKFGSWIVEITIIFNFNESNLWKCDDCSSLHGKHNLWVLAELVLVMAVYFSVLCNSNHMDQHKY